MISIEEKENLLNNLKYNSLNSFTVECIVQYANISSDIFNIDHGILINNLSNNLKNDIIFSKNFCLLSNILGSYNFESKQIMINAKVKNKQHIISLIFHELDHAASCQHIKPEDKLKYLSTYLEKLNTEHPFVFKIPFIKSFIEKRFLKSKSFSCGFNNPFIGKILGVNLNLFKEGITTYKQSKYEKYLNLSDRITTKDNNYKNEMRVAQLIIEIIGEDKIMQLEQNNDILGLKKNFESITQKQISFEDLIQQLNNTSIESKRILENQKKLNNTLEKIVLCKKAYDYCINLGESTLSLAEIQSLVTSYEEKLKFYSNIKKCTCQNVNNIDFKPVKLEDSYIK